MINGLPPGFSRYHMTTLNQGRIEQCFLDNIKDCSDIRVERNVMPQSMEIDESLVDDDEAYPIKVKLLHFNELDAMPGQMMNGNANEKRENGLYRSNLVSDDTEEMLDNASNSSSTTEETVRARYIIGCEGAHSWTRRQLGFGMEGESRDTVWGVIDLVPITNFRKLRDENRYNSS